jgi:serine/threonine protein kinase
MKLKKLLSRRKEPIRDDETLVMTDIPNPEQTLFPEIVASRYRVKRSLGKGAFGIVYLAEDKKIGRLVSIKLLFKHFVKNRKVYDRFMLEAKIGAQLDHPNIINVFALEEDHESACIIMEYLSGGSLEAFMKQNGAIHPGTALRIFNSILKGLEAAHQIMTVHCDIKPSNIVFDHLGQPKITDFGIAYLPMSHSTSDGEFGVQSSNVIGTPRYMSPEQIKGEKVDCRTDLYSAGTVLYEMLSGEKVLTFFNKMNMDDIKKVILFHKPKKLVGVPEPLVKMVMKLIEKDREDRYSSASEVLKEIEQLFQVCDTCSQATTKIDSVGNLVSSPVAMFEDIVRLLLVDGVLAPSERRELNRRAERLGISKTQSRLIEDKIRAEKSLPPLASIEDYKKLAEKYFSENIELKFNHEQKEVLKAKRKELHIKREEANILERHSREKVRLSRKKEAAKS